MAKTAWEKFEGIDHIFQLPKIKYFIVPTQKGETFKRFEVQWPKDNREEKKKALEEINSILSDESANAMYNPRFAYLTEKSKRLHNEFEVRGEIRCSMNQSDILEVEVFYKDEEPKKFVFDDNQYLDALLEYLTNEYQDKIIKEF